MRSVSWSRSDQVCVNTQQHGIIDVIEQLNPGRQLFTKCVSTKRCPGLSWSDRRRLLLMIFDLSYLHSNVMSCYLHFEMLIMDLFTSRRVMFSTKVDLKQIRQYITLCNKMNSKTSILDLPPEIVKIIFQKIDTIEDKNNCQKACEIYTDPRILKILCQIQFDNEGIFILLIFI